MQRDIHDKCPTNIDCWGRFVFLPCSVQTLSRGVSREVTFGVVARVAPAVA